MDSLDTLWERNLKMVYNCGRTGCILLFCQGVYILSCLAFCNAVSFARQYVGGSYIVLPPLVNYLIMTSNPVLVDIACNTSSVLLLFLALQGKVSFSRFMFVIFPMAVTMVTSMLVLIIYRPLLSVFPFIPDGYDFGYTDIVFVLVSGALFGLVLLFAFKWKNNRLLSVMKTLAKF